MLLSVVVNYYQNETALHFFMDAFRKMAVFFADEIELVLVDDCSPTPVDPAVFLDIKNISVLRVTEDIPWNMPAARNIGALEARGRVILFVDVDHVVEEDEFEHLLEDVRAIQLGVRLTPNRKRPGDEVIHNELKPNINCFLISRQDFFKVGGYEEIFSGCYGFEDKYFRYCCRWAGVEDRSASFRLSVLKGGATKGLPRDTARNKTIFDTLHAARMHRAEHVLMCRYVRLV